MDTGRVYFVDVIRTLLVASVGGVVAAGTWLGLLWPCYLICPLVSGGMARSYAPFHALAVNPLATGVIYLVFEGWSKPFPSDYLKFGGWSLLLGLMWTVLLAHARRRNVVGQSPGGEHGHNQTMKALWSTLVGTFAVIGVLATILTI